MELDYGIIPSGGFARRGPGRRPAAADAELACLAVAQVLLRHDDERHWLRATPKPVGHLFPGCWARASTDFEEFLAGEDLELILVRPARRNEKTERPFPNWLRQGVEAVIWTLKNQLGLEHHGGRVPAGLWARIVQRLLALNAAIWHNYMTGT